MGEYGYHDKGGVETMRMWGDMVSMTEGEVDASECGWVCVSDREVGWCLEPEGNGVSPSRVNEGGPSPPSGQQDKQLTASRGGDNSPMEQEEDGKKGQM